MKDARQELKPFCWFWPCDYFLPIMKGPGIDTKSAKNKQSAMNYQLYAKPTLYTSLNAVKLDSGSAQKLQKEHCQVRFVAKLYAWGLIIPLSMGTPTTKIVFKLKKKKEMS